MPQKLDLQLARLADATPIATMSRDLIELGLGRSWTPARVASQIRCPDTIVLVARTYQGIAGFGIMQFKSETAHLNLFAVAQPLQRRGIGSRILRWLESSADAAGITTIALEVRASNGAGQAFYRLSGYEEIMRLPGYYQGREAALRMARFLRMSEGLAGLFALPRNAVTRVQQ
jgi:ribosomal protein S18 acetylase RimI-like enzyme